MALYAIGDLHLSFEADKPMDVFGKLWTGYVDKLRTGLSVIGPEDTTVLMGDLSWSMDLDHAVEDFAFMNAIPGRKIILKGNHDYWWTTASKFYKFCEAQGFSNMEILNNNCYLYGQTAICGTRGWFFEEERGGEHDAKILNRELMRLEASLKAAGDREKLVFLHYPPVYRGYRCQPILELLHRYQVNRCWYGHLHSESHKLAIIGEYEGIDFRLAAADYTGFRPIVVKTAENS
ncbi:MAG: metallophosphoesterase [Oscillospiraceae bacterium]|nr:metallophosphoesterase [Oscillospiraceae bacterium]